MDIHTLLTRLEGYISGNRLDLPSANDLESADISRLIGEVPPDARLIIDDLQLIRTEPTIVYTGRAALFAQFEPAFQQEILEVRTEFYILQDTAQLTITVDPLPADWTLAKSFSGLEESVAGMVEFSTAALALASIDADVPGFGPIPFGTSFTGIPALSGAIGAVATLLINPQTIRLQGPITVATDKAPRLKLSGPGNGPIDIGPFSFDAGIELECIVIEGIGAEGETVEIPIPSAALTAVITIGSGGELQIPVRLELASDDPKLVTFQILDASIPLGNWSYFSQITDGINLGALIPSNVPQSAALTIKTLAVTIDLASLSLCSTLIDVKLDGVEWSIIPNGILSITDVGARFAITPSAGILGAPPDIDGIIYGTDAISLVNAIAGRLQVSLCHVRHPSRWPSSFPRVLRAEQLAHIVPQARAIANLPAPRNEPSSHRLPLPEFRGEETWARRAYGNQ